jgi:hypothetical protein
MSLRKVPFGFAPTSITGCQLWLDGADSSSASMTFSSGSNISVWKDKSGSANNATAVGVPTYGANTVIMGGSAYFTLPGISANSSNEAFFMVVNWSSSGAEQPFFIGTTLNGGRCLFISPGSPTLVGSSYNVGNTSIGTNGGTPANTIIIVELMTSSLVNTVYTNGQNAGSPVAASYSGGGTSVIGVGFNEGAPRATQYLTGNIYEVVMYNTAITNTQRQQVESYLAQKWGITASLPGGHPGLTTTVFKADYIKNSAIIRNVAKPIPYFAAFSPRQIPGCSLWMDAADSSSLTLSSSLVTQWNDKSGNLRNASSNALSGLTYPSLSANTVTMTGSQGLTITSGFPSNPYCIFVVGAPLASTATWRTGIQVKGSGVANTHSIIIETGSTRFGNWFNQFNPHGALTWGGSNALAYVQLNANLTMNATMNGTVTLTTSTPAVGAASASIIYLGNVEGGSQPWGSFNEIIMYNSILSLTQRQQVESYLAQKWGLTTSLPGGHSHLTQRAGAITTVANTKFSMVGVPRIIFTATGGTIVTSGFKYHLFTSSSNFVVSMDSKTVNYLVVGGGGGGGDRHGGGGGGGGVLTGTWTASVGTYTVTVGPGGQYGATAEGGQTVYGSPAGAGSKGGDSLLSGTGISVTAYGGGGGGTYEANPTGTVGSGGGGGGNGFAGVAGTAGQGNAGGSGSNPAGGGGGGAGGVGADANTSTGGIGTTSFSSHLLAVGYGTSFAVPTSPNVVISGGVAYIAAGGGGAAASPPGPGGSGGLGGGGRGDWNASFILAGTANTGGGGGGSRSDDTSTTGRDGGSGLVLLWYAI